MSGPVKTALSLQTFDADMQQLREFTSHLKINSHCTFEKYSGRALLKEWRYVFFSRTWSRRQLLYVNTASQVFVLNRIE